MMVGASGTAGEPWSQSALTFMASTAAGRMCDDPERFLIEGGAGQVSKGMTDRALENEGSH